MAVVEVAEFVLEDEPLGLDLGPEGIDLAGDSVVLGLLVGGDPCIEGDAWMGQQHDSSPLDRRTGRAARRGVPSGGRSDRADGE